jgi:hypothetical protein
MCANFRLLLLSHILHISPTTHTPFPTQDTMSVPTKHTLPASSYIPTDGSKQTFGPKGTEPDVVLLPRVYVPPRGPKARVRINIRDRAENPLASQKSTGLDKEVTQVAVKHHRELRKEWEKQDGSVSVLTKSIGEAVKEHCDKSKVSVAVCYNWDDYQSVLAQNPDLVDERSAKREARQKLSENHTASVEGSPETKFLGYYDSDPGQCEDGDSNDGEETASHKIKKTNRGWDSD